MDKLDTLGARLKWARKEAKLTQAAAARAIGLSQPTLSDLENDNTKGSTSLVEIASVYGLDVRWLKTGRGAPRQARDGEEVNPAITEQQLPLSLDSVRMERARLLAESLVEVSAEMRNLIEVLIDADREGGAVREMTLAGVGYVLQSVPKAQTHKKVK